MAKKLHKLSAQKLAELKRELEELKSKGREEISNRLESVQHEIVEELDNTFFSINEDKFFLEKRINELNDIIEHTQIVEVEDSAETVCLGVKVKVGFENYDDTYIIVDPIEADPLSKKIASDSPVGSVLMGRKVGDTVSVEIAGLKKVFRILSIN